MIIIDKISLHKNDAIIVKINDGNLLYDVNSSNIIELTNEEIDLLKSISPDNRNETNIAVKYSRLCDLINNNIIFCPDNRIKSSEATNELQIFETVLQVAYTCNMRCSYCYADSGKYGGNLTSLMTRETARAAIDFAFENRATNTLGFGIMGGEPLLNFETVKDIISYSLKKDQLENTTSLFSLTTNGLLLNNDIVDYLERNNISVRMSLDGNKRLHDLYRHDVKGNPTYDRINDGGGRLLKKSKINYLIRCSILGDHGHELPDQVSNLFSDQYNNIKVDFLWNMENHPGTISESNFNTVCEGIDSLAIWFHNKLMNNDLKWHQVFPFAKYIGKLISKDAVSYFYNAGNVVSSDATFDASLLEKMGVECGAGYNVVSVSANGDIYPCHRLENIKSLKLGSVFDGVDRRKTKYWTSNWRLEKSDCRNCWAKYICAGGCPAFGYYKHRDPMKVDNIKCEIRKRFILWSIWILNEITKKGLVCLEK
ncbi:MAG: radical SAM protein [Pseudomonadota bacterium]